MKMTPAKKTAARVHRKPPAPRARKAPSPRAVVSTPAPPRGDDGVHEAQVIQATQRIELRCGEASLVLTKDGDILLNGRLLTLKANEVSVESDSELRLVGSPLTMN